MQYFAPRSPCGQAGPLRLVTFRATGHLLTATAHIRAGRRPGQGRLGRTLIYEAGIRFPRKTSRGPAQPAGPLAAPAQVDRCCYVWCARSPPSGGISWEQGIGVSLATGSQPFLGHLMNSRRGVWRGLGGHRKLMKQVSAGWCVRAQLL